MKKLFLLLLLGFTLLGFSQNTLIPDPNFEQALIDRGYDTAPINGSVPTANISGVTSLYILNYGIFDLTGIQDFESLEYLECGQNNISLLDLSANINLIDLACYDNQITSLNISNSPNLRILQCFQNELTTIDVSNNPNIELLNCWENQLTSLNVSNNSSLINLSCSSNQLTTLDMSNNPNIESLNCTDNQLTHLNVSNNPVLHSIGCGNNQLTSLDVSNCMALESLYFQDNQITNIDLSNNPILSVLSCTSNLLTNLDVSNNPHLEYLWCHANSLENLEVRNGNNTIIPGTGTGGNVYFDSRDNPNLTCIYVENAEYSSQNWTNIDPASTFVENEAECDALSIGENALELDVFVYPNPTDNYLFVEGNKNPISISIYNLLGAEVISKSNTDKINVSELSNGVYIIRISDGIGQTNRKFIKN